MNQIQNFNILKSLKDVISLVKNIKILNFEGSKAEQKCKFLLIAPQMVILNCVWRGSDHGHCLVNRNWVGWGIPNHVASILVMLTSMLWVHLIMSLSTVIAAIIAQLLKHERKEILEISI